jgi:FkbM family methyltransferase
VIIPSSTDQDIPFYFRIAKASYVLLRGWKGEFFLYHVLDKLGLLGRAGRFSYFDKSIFVPLKVPETLFVYDFSLFHGLREINFAHELNKTLDNFTLLDCGAYYGQVSMRLAYLCPRLDFIVAIDANSDNIDVIENNLASTSKAYKVLNIALSDRGGRGNIKFPNGKMDPDSAYIQVTPDGEITIKSLDVLFQELEYDLVGKDIAIKIDIEGHEELAIIGAEKLIKQARRVCFFIELHAGVLKRNGRTAEDLLKAVESIRPVKWYLAHKPELEIVSGQSVFQQIGGEIICDVIGVAV